MLQKCKAATVTESEKCVTEMCILYRPAMDDRTKLSPKYVFGFTVYDHCEL